MKRAHIFLIAAASGLGAGFFFRMASPTKAANLQNSATKAQQTEKTPSTAPRAGKVPNATPNTLAASLEKELANSAGVTKWLLWISAIDRAALDDLPHLARLAANTPTALRMLTAHWIGKDRQHLVTTLMNHHGADTANDAFPARSLCEALIDDWTTADPDAVLTLLSQPNLPGIFESQKNSFVSKLVRSDPERALKTMHQFGVSSFGFVEEEIAKWAKKDPAHAAQVALEYACGYGSASALKAIAGVWSQQDPAAAVAFASGLKNSDGMTFFAHIMQGWSKSQPAKAAEWMVQADPVTRNLSAKDFVSGWATQDAAAALGWAQEHLEGKTLISATAGVLEAHAVKNPAAAAEFVASMPADAARTKAATAVLDKWLPKWHEEMKISPEVTAWLTKLDKASLAAALDQNMHHWLSCDQASLAEFLTTPAGAMARADTAGQVGAHLARNDPAAALTWAAKLQPTLQTEAQNRIFSSWQQSQPTAAAAWFQAEPVGSPQRIAYCQQALSQAVPAYRELGEKIAKSRGSEVSAILQNEEINATQRQVLQGVLGLTQ